ncbi:alpha/beta hydrolase [Paracraurococcus lichenis]|uniref:Alpha/beta hydrolase n=1 Tax=Paracraurococcus lichenis TaxID=3064888 RepID=A0ABT9DW32_9PROT|nr:alpha/beta hydrolase [Paracraurococcus sp. LOR1-02]MDO9708104.1 alpha/beta hydrolase [Paracraurococcus sp. LOR1-02]
MHPIRTGLAAALAALLASPLCAAAQGNPPPATLPSSVPAVESNVARQGYFYVGGRYAGEPGREVMLGQIYVEVWAPREVKHPYPLVLFHGASSTGTTWMQTPDGRKGWAHLFVDMGYIVYITDQPARGRSAYQAALQGRQIAATVAGTERNNTNAREAGTWPQAKLHTQYPGEGPDRGRKGNPVFDAGFARSVPYLASNHETQDLVQQAGAALLDRIGPAILVTHSQAGPFGWLLADARPNLVKGIVAIEPSGPPFENQVNATGRARPWGPADIRLTYDPPVTDPAQLAVERQAEPEAPNLVPCWLQSGPPRSLPNLRGIPVAIITGEASYHAPYDHCTARYLAQAGVAVEHIRLEARGIHGNGHGIPSELNNVQTARLVDDWLGAKLR